MLMPKRVKYRKQQRGKMRGKAKGGTSFTSVIGVLKLLSHTGSRHSKSSLSYRDNENA